MKNNRSRALLISMLLASPLYLQAANSHYPFNTESLSVIAKKRADSQYVTDEYIVRFKSQVDADTVSQVSRSLVSHARNKAALKPRHLKSINGFVAKMSSQQLANLAMNPDVLAIEPNQILRVSGATANADSWGIDRLDQANLPLDQVYNPYGTGNGVHAYVIDSGIRVSHADFAGRAQWDFTASNINDGDQDGLGRGTHIAGSLGGGNYGVAREVQLHAVKVVDNQGVGTLAGLIEGIEYVTNHHQAPAVATLGLSVNYSSILNDAINASIAAGVSFAVAGGDDNKEACLYSPASVSDAIVVASSDIHDNASGSANYGSCIDLFAPGLYIKSDWGSSDTANNTISHSPMAAAHAAGAAALIRANDPACSVSQVKDILLAQSYSGVLNSMPSNTPNRLLAVPSSVGSEASCGAPTGNNVTVNDNLTDYTANHDVVNVSADLFSDAVDAMPSNQLSSSIYGVSCYSDGEFLPLGNTTFMMMSGSLSCDFTPANTLIGFDIFRDSAVTIKLTADDGEVTEILAEHDGYYGLTSDKPIASVTFVGGLNLMSRLSIGEVSTAQSRYSDATAFAQTGQYFDFDSVARHVKVDTPVNDLRIHGGTLSSSSADNIVIAASGHTDFAVTTTSKTITAQSQQDFTLTFDYPPKAIGFNTVLNPSGAATVTVKMDDGSESSFTVDHDANQLGYFGLVSNKAIESIRWQSGEHNGIKSGITNVITDVDLPDNRSCKALLDDGGSIGDGVYSIDPDGTGAGNSYLLQCDMTRDGGGWTGITADFAFEYIDWVIKGDLVHLKDRPDVILTVNQRLLVAAINKDILSYYQFPLGFSYSQFYFDDFRIQGAGHEAASADGCLPVCGYDEINFEVGSAGTMTTWQTGVGLDQHHQYKGDVGVGSPDDLGPAFTLTSRGDVSLGTGDERRIDDTYIYQLGAPATEVRIAWSQKGQYQGIKPWNRGTIFVR